MVEGRTSEPRPILYRRELERRGPQGVGGEFLVARFGLLLGDPWYVQRGV